LASGRNVLAQIVRADIHQLDRVERATPEMGRRRSMRGLPVEAELHPQHRKGLVGLDRGEAGGMPVECDIDIVERTGARHERLSRTALLRRTAIVAYAGLDA